MTGQEADQDGLGAQSLLTPYVFVDTTAFWKANFNWESPSYNALERLCQAGVLKLVTTDIIRRECEAHLRAKLEAAREALGKARKVSSILLQVDRTKYQPLFEKMDVDAAHIVLKERLAAYLKGCRAETLDVYAIAPEGIFDAYFSGDAPFGGGEKKAEFPDAFNVAALRAFTQKPARAVYVVSEDGDLRNACGVNGSLIHVAKIEEVISVAQAEHDLRQRLDAAVRRLQPDLLKFLEREFPDRGFILEDQDGEIEDVEVIDFEMGDVFVIDRRADWFEMEVTGAVRYTATATYDDMDTATWDSEDKVAIPWRRITRDLDEEEYVTFTIAATMDDEGHLEVEAKTFGTPRDVYVHTERQDHYK